MRSAPTLSTSDLHECGAQAGAVTLLAWPGLRASWFEAPVPLRLCPRPKIAAEDYNCLAILIMQNGMSAVSYVGGDTSRERDRALFLLAECTGTTASLAKYVSLTVPRAALRPLVGNLEGVVMRLVPQDCEALRLLVKYLGILRENTTLGMPELRHLAVTHVYHLIAMALSSTRSGSTIANGHEARAARLRAIKADILENLGDLELTVTSVALRQRITPRYVHMLFEVEGITFSEFVLGQRLMRAHSMLCDPQFRRLKYHGHRLCGRVRRSVLFQSHLPPPLWRDSIRPSQRQWLWYSASDFALDGGCAEERHFRRGLACTEEFGNRTSFAPHATCGAANFSIKPNEGAKRNAPPVGITHWFGASNEVPFSFEGPKNKADFAACRPLSSGTF